MRTFYAKEHGIISGKDVTTELIDLINTMSDINGDKQIIFDKGVYILNSDKALRPKLYITNTIGKKEWKRDETENENRTAIYIKNIDSLILDGNESIFEIYGQMTNAVVSDSKNITLKNLTFRVVNPDMHELKVVKRGFNYIDYCIDSDSKYEKTGKSYSFIGQGYRSGFNDNSITAHWIGRVPYYDENVIERVNHPLRGMYSIKERNKNVFRVKYLIPPRYHIGDSFYLFDVRRKYQGLFLEKSCNITLKNVKQHFNYGLAVVAQDCENIDMESCVFAPEKDSPKKMASVADFVQICMCRGDINIKNSYFEGSGDDALNVHGIHFQVTDINENVIKIRFMHAQSYGFCPFWKGDVIRFIDNDSLNEVGSRYTVCKARSIDNYEIELTVNEKVEQVKRAVIENISAIPNLLYEKNTLNRIITRGLLITTSGKVEVKNNKFISTSMNAIHIADDAKNWYESGNVSNVSIENNYFGRCKGYTLETHPENSKHIKAVHNGIRIHHNVIDSNGEGGFSFKSTDNVSISENTVRGKIRKLKSVRSDVREENNIYETDK